MIIIKYMIASRVSRLSSRIHHAFAKLSDKEIAKRRGQMKFNREKAVWACQIFNTIKYTEVNNETTIDKDSLREQILKLNISDFECSSESRSSVLKMFDQGIPLNKTVFDKISIEPRKGKAPVSQPKINQDGQQKKNKPIHDHFIFCPNKLVTRYMFQYLTMPHRLNVMIVGGYGISKTISIVLLHQLSSIINEYMYLASSDPEEKSHLQQLKNTGYLFDVPKFFYWNIYFNKTQPLCTEKDLINILMKQATELSKDDKAQLELQKKLSLPLFANKLKNLYQKKNIETKVVIDHLHITASLLRRWNMFYLKYKQTEKEQYTKPISKLYELLNEEPTQTYKNYINQLKIIVIHQLFILCLWEYEFTVHFKQTKFFYKKMSKMMRLHLNQ